MFQIILCHQVIIPSWGYVDGTFNPIQDKWYLGNIILPSTVILLKCMKAITFEIVWLARLDGAPCRKFTWDTGTPILPGPHILGYKFQRLMILQFSHIFSQICVKSLDNPVLGPFLFEGCADLVQSPKYSRICEYQIKSMSEILSYVKSRYLCLITNRGINYLFRFF